MIEASSTTIIVTSIVTSAVGITTILGVMMGFMFRSVNIQFTHVNSRLERVENRIDEIGRDIGELRDRTGKLEGTLATFIQSQRKGEAA